MKNSANSILIKARAMSTGLLDNNKIRTAVSCKSVNELALFLRDNTVYSDSLNSFITADTTHERIEAALKNHLIASLDKFVRYEKSIGTDFYNYFTVVYDTEYLLDIIRFHNNGRSEDIYNIIVPDKKYSKLDNEKIMSSKDYKEFINALSGTGYEKMLKDYSKLDGTPQTILAVSALFMKYKNKTTSELINKNCKGNDRKEINDFFKSISDIDMLIKLLRLYKLSDSNAAIAFKFIDDTFTLLRSSQLKTLKNANKYEEVEQVFKNYINNKSEMPEYAARKALCAIYKKQLRYTDNAVIAMFSYLMLLENEIKNLTHITEAIRYKLSKEQIDALLVL
ncbi:V-type ATPase subunit [Eubacteriales bacterium OttesenSCG-928-G02]|nr:V-type ATPase subunit [Eubacteriales bacterium OttesenSCG-928-G02]